MGRDIAQACNKVELELKSPKSEFPYGGIWFSCPFFSKGFSRYFGCLSCAAQEKYQ